MRYRTARTLVCSLRDGRVIGCNFLTRSVFECSPDILALLAGLDDWSEPAALVDLVDGAEPDDIAEALSSLAGHGAVVAEGSALATQEAEFERDWGWGMSSALLHFSQFDKDFLTLDEAEGMQRARLESEGAVPLYQPNPAGSLRLPDPLSGNELIALMAKRRSVRFGTGQALSIPSVSDCLFAGLGITGETANCVGRLPLKMTPSGGARNPYEAWLAVRNVEGLAPGLYHYAAIDHTLAPIAGGQDLSFSSMIGGQEWGEDMAAFILLSAHFERTMWKYEDDNAYRVVLIEAGHIAQNIMLAATRNGLTAVPTAALNHTMIRNAIGDRSMSHAPVYALGLAVPDHARAAAMRRH